MFCFVLVELYTLVLDLYVSMFFPMPLGGGVIVSIIESEH